MRFGLYINPQTYGPHDDGIVIRELLGQIDLAARLGFDSVWFTEHHFTGYNAYSDPIVLAAAVSQRVGLELGFSIAIGPLHHPIRFVEQCNLLDQVSNGRLTIGLGPGNSPLEFRGFGRDQGDRHAMLAEFLDVARRAWNAPVGGFSYEGRWWSGQVQGRVIPAPVQKPHPRLAIGTTTMDTVERLGREATPWLIAASFSSDKLVPYLQRYLAGMDAGGLDETTRRSVWGQSAYVIKIHLLEDGESWEAGVGENVDFFTRRNLTANFGMAEEEITPEQFLQNREFFMRGFFAGDDAALVDLLTPYARLGIGTVMCWLNWGRVPDRLIRRTIERLAATVLPALRSVGPDQDLFDNLRQREQTGPRLVWTRGPDGYAWVEDKAFEGTV